ncbi:MAG: anthranilate phosphoribosyltransferase [Crenarchaeota archaeon]|nr:anthranilate phosphoribosyltransferase [Thermoproteota archaeon]
MCEGIQKLIEGQDLTFQESGDIMTEVISGKATSSQTAAFLTALRMKGEVVDEIIAFASVMKSCCRQINPRVQGRLVDIVGTGGDKLKTFNISTTASFVIAGAGIPVAKHGNRSVTSKSGSADVLENLGLNIALEPQAIELIIEQVGVGFMFAPIFHPAMKYVAESRREIGIPTIFNILGPLTNPASASGQIVGVYDVKLVEQMSYALQRLGCQEAIVVHGLDGLDEISTVGKTVIAHLKDGIIKVEEYAPSDFGFKQAQAGNLQCASAEESAETLFKILTAKETGTAKSDIVLLNAAAGIIVAGKAAGFKDALQSAHRSIASGAAYRKLKALVQASGGNPSKLEELEKKYA